MPLGAERVGTAYVRIIADGSGLSDDIRDELRQSEPAIEAQGRKDGQVYVDSFKERISANENDIFRSFREALDTGAGRNDGTARVLAGSLFNDFEREIQERVGDADIARIIRLDLEKQFRRGSSLGSVVAAFGRNYEQMVESAIKRIQGLEERVDKERRAREQAALDDIFAQLKKARDEREALREAELKQNLDAEQAHQRDLERLEQDRIDRLREDIIERYRLEDEAARQREELANQEIAERLRGERAYDAEVQRIEQGRIDRLRADIIERSRLADEARKQEIKDLRAGVQGLAKDLNDLERGAKGAAATQSRLRRSVLDLREALEGYDDDGSLSRELTRINSELDRMTPRFDRVNKRLGDFETLIGRSTGKGSRNNFLNFVGSLTQGVTGLLGKLPRFGALLADAFGKGFDAKGGGLGGFFGGLLGAGSAGFKAIASNVATLAAALAALAIVIGPLVAGLSLLLGTITALAGSLTFALFGAVAGATALFIPFAFAVGTAVTALQGLDKAQKRALANDFKPLVRQAKELRSALADAFVGAFDSSGVSSSLTAGLKTVQPLLTEIAKAVADVAERFADIGTSDAFEKFVGAMERVLPEAIRDIGDGLAGFTEGFLGVFRALAPTIRSVADSLREVGERFGEWANSAEGQETLRQFFRDAADSLSAVKGFLGDVIGLISDLFSAGRGTGDDLFTSIGDAVDRFRSSIADGSIEKWFRDSAKFARTLGDAFVAVGGVIDALDNDITRLAIGAVFKQLTLVGEGMQASFKITQQVLIRLAQAFVFVARAITATLGEIGGAVVNVAGDVLDVLANMVEAVAGIPGFGEPFKGLAEDLRGAEENVRGFAESVREMGGARERLAGVSASLSDVAKGVSPEDLKKLQLLRDRIENIPDAKITDIVAEGTELSVKKIRGLVKEYDLTPSEVNTLTRLLGDDVAKTKIGALMREIRTLDNQQPNPRITVEDRASAIIKSVIGFLNVFDRDRSITVTTNYRSTGSPAPAGSLGGPREDFPSTAGRTVAPRATSLASPFPEAAPRSTAPAMASAGRSIDASGWTIVTPAEDPRTVAAEVLNEIAAKVM